MVASCKNRGTILYTNYHTGTQLTPYEIVYNNIHLSCLPEDSPSGVQNGERKC